MQPSPLDIPAGLLARLDARDLRRHLAALDTVEHADAAC